MATPIIDFLLKNAEEAYASFHVPGHKGMEIYKKWGYSAFLERFMDCDLTEIEGSDNLFAAEGIIKEVQDKYAKLYEVKKSYLLINGSSVGIISAILASVSKGGKMIVARNCHKSVFNALRLGDIKPTFVFPEIDKEYGIAGGVSAKSIENLIIKNPDAEAVIVTSPNYYGICSDIKAIAEVVHRYNKILIVDQAHGAHLKFFNKYFPNQSGWGKEIPLCAEDGGADIVINSIHKTLASFTSTAILNLCSDRVAEYAIEDMLQMLQTSSPSYLLMASADINADILEKHGQVLISEWKKNVEKIYAKFKTIEGVELMECPQLDKTKLNIDMSTLGISGKALDQRIAKMGVKAEMHTENTVMCMSGIGNSSADFERLADVIMKISEEEKDKLCSAENQEETLENGEKLSIANRRCISNIKEFADLEFCGIPAQKEEVLLQKSENRVCAAAISLYPPGIPVVCAGEKITKEVIEYVEELIKKGEKILGINERHNILVGK